MLAILKSGKITSVVTPMGQTLSMSGYKEIGDSIIASLGANDIEAKNMIQSQWEKIIGDRLVKKNLDQLFKIFPDSAVHLKDTWQLASKEEGEINMTVRNTYTLKAINSEIALISSEGKIVSDNAPITALGMSNVNADLKGDQQAEYEMEAKTGMLISCNLITNVSGTLQVMGREIPIKIKTVVTIKGKRK